MIYQQNSFKEYSDTFTTTIIKEFKSFKYLT